MSRIAVDVVLLPNAEVTAKTLQVNGELVAHHGSEIVLDARRCLPHISLAMGCVEPDAIEPVKSILAELPTRSAIGDLIITGVVTSLNRRRQSVSVFALAKTRALQDLHESIMDAMTPYFSYEVNEDMIYSTEPVAPSTLDWIHHFREKAAFGAFFPHITIGYGMVEQTMSFPMHFSAAGLAICHLGNHCTCRNLLASVSL